MLKIIACNIMRREIEHILTNYLKEDVIFVEQGLHNNPSKMKIKLQNIIDEIEEKVDTNVYTHIVLLYGLCGNGTLGLKTSKLKLVIPKAHDCMSLFLGDKNKYKEIINENKGIYWYNHAWIDQTPMPSEKNLKTIKEHYIAEYGEDNGVYLYQLDIGALKKYNYGVIINSPIVDNDKYKKILTDSCKFFGWELKEVNGNLQIIENLIKGVFDDVEVLNLPKNTPVNLEIIN